MCIYKKDRDRESIQRRRKEEDNGDDDDDDEDYKYAKNNKKIKRMTLKKISNVLNTYKLQLDYSSSI